MGFDTNIGILHRLLYFFVGFYCKKSEKIDNIIWSLSVRSLITNYYVFLWSTLVILQIYLFLIQAAIWWNN